MKLAAAFLAGAATGIAVFLFWLGKTMSTGSEKVPQWVHQEEALPPFDPHLWRERMR